MGIDLRISDDVLHRPEGRGTWRSRVSLQALTDVCAERAAYHAGRLVHWTNELVAREDELRGKGIELRETQVTGGNQFQAVVDGPLGSAVSDARQKVARHRAQAALYARWAEFLKGVEGSDGTLMLTWDDYEFFQSRPPEAE